jgi:hypothetical protein
MRDARPWTYAALFGALWGAAELTVGTALSLSLQALAGPVMGVVGLVCLVTLRRLQPRVGVCALAGAVALFLKVMALGGLRPGPLLGIAGEALLVEVAFSLTASRRPGAALAGALALAAPPAQLGLGLWALGGRDVLRAWGRAIARATELLGLPEPPSAPVVIGVVLGGFALVGVAAGLWAWRLAGRVQRRLGGGP